MLHTISRVVMVQETWLSPRRPASAPRVVRFRGWCPKEVPGRIEETGWISTALDPAFGGSACRFDSTWSCSHALDFGRD